MNVKVEIELYASVKQKDKKEMYGAAEFLTNDTDSIYIYQPKGKSHNKEFSYNMENYSQSTISFPDKPTKKKSNRSRDYNARFTVTPNCKRLQGAADARRTGTQTYSLYFKCPTTKQVRCPVNAYKDLKR